jgi:hypothetical protein
MDPQLYFAQLLMNLPSWPQMTSTHGSPIAGMKAENGPVPLRSNFIVMPKCYARVTTISRKMRFK